MNNIKITIFTPTFNRKKLLQRLYQSLLEQTCHDFEWIVVDDGSTDGTEDLFVKDQGFSDCKFIIKYYKLNNGGKHRAINRGVREAEYSLFFIVDSDDYLVPNAVEKILSWYCSLDSTHKWAGISGLKGTSEDSVIGSRMTADYIDATNLEREKYKLLGDKAEVYLTEVLKRYPFPEFEGEKFVTEATVWDAIAGDGYYIRWFNDIIYICEYLEDGLTKNGEEKFINSPQGTRYRVKQILKLYSSNKKKYSAINRYYTDFSARFSIKEIADQLEISLYQIVAARLFVSLGRMIRKVQSYKEKIFDDNKRRTIKNQKFH